MICIMNILTLEVFKLKKLVNASWTKRGFRALGDENLITYSYTYNSHYIFLVS